MKGRIARHVFHYRSPLDGTEQPYVVCAPQEAAGPLPEAGVLLVNPRKALPTAAVFAARRGPFGDVGRFAPMPGEAPALARALMPCRNDLTEAAIDLVPEIATVLARLGRLPGSLLARMSGSGATCFALFADRAAAEEARALVASAEPRWWCAAAGFVSRPKRPT